MKNKRIWVAWETQRRTVELSRKFNARLHILETRRKGFFRYLELTARTLKVLASVRPDVIFVQNPSVILATLVLCLKPLFGFTVIVDRHTNFKFETRHSRHPKWLLFHLLSRFTLRRADITIVTNRYLRLYVKKQGAHAHILPDPIPTLTPSKNNMQADSHKQPAGFFVCTFAGDEPYPEVFQAMGQLPQVNFVVTGNFRKAGSRVAEGLPSNIHLLGFVPEQEYIDTLFGCDFSIILTTQEFTLNCGAYETLAANKPAILANTHTIRQYFRRGFVHTTPDAPNEIAAAIRKTLENLNSLKAEQQQLKAELTVAWLEQKAVIDREINGLAP